MTELITTTIITATSVLLFGYWFRYTCMLILSAKTVREFAHNLAQANQLGFASVQAQLSANSTDLDRLRDSLDRDYAVLRNLLQQTSHMSNGNEGLEERMLQLNYKVTGVWYQLVNHFSPAAARKALEEMSMMVAHFADVMGERAAAGAAA